MPSEDRLRLQPTHSDNIGSNNSIASHDVLSAEAQEQFRELSTSVRQYSNAVVTELEKRVVPLPPDGPITAPRDSAGQLINPDLVDAIDIRKYLPTVGDTVAATPEALVKAGRAGDWAARASVSVTRLREQHLDRELVETINEKHYPQEWLPKPGQDRAAWRRAAQSMLALVDASSGYIGAMQALVHASRGADFPTSLPRGARIDIQTGDKAATLRATDMDLFSSKQLMHDGKLQTIHLDLPKELDLSDPKARAIADWLNEFGPKIDRTLQRVKQLENGGIGFLMAGDMEMHGSQGRFDASGKFLGLYRADKRLSANEHVQPFDSLHFDFELTKTGDGPSAEYSVLQSVQPRKLPTVNIAGLGVQDVGKPLSVSVDKLKGDDYLPVDSGGTLQIEKISNLSSFRAVEKAQELAPKLMPVIDVATIASGAVGITAVAKGVTLAGSAALKLTATEAAINTTVNAMKIGAGLAGAIEHSAMADTAFGAAATRLRGLFFTGDMVGSLAHAGVRGVGTFMAHPDAAVSAMGAGEKLAMLSSNSVINQLSTSAFKVFEPYFAYDSGKMINDVVQADEDARLGNGLEVARLRLSIGGAIAADGVTPVSDAGHPAPRLGTANDAELLANYARELSYGASPTTANQVADIMKQTTAAIKSHSSNATRQRLSSELASITTFDSSELQDIERTFAGSDGALQLDETRVHAVLHPRDADEFKAPAERWDSLKARAQEISDSKDPAVKVAAAIALLHLSRYSDGSFGDDNIFTAKTDIPAYERKGKIGASEQTFFIPQHSVDINIRASDLVSNLQDVLSDKAGQVCTVAIADTLHRMRQLSDSDFTHALAAVAMNQSLPVDIRASAIVDAHTPRLAAIALTSKDFEARTRALKALDQVVLTDGNKDMRALGTAVIMASVGDISNKDKVGAAITSAWNVSKPQPGLFYSMAEQQLLTEANRPLQDAPEAASERARAVRRSRLDSANLLTGLLRRDDPGVAVQVANAVAGAAAGCDVVATVRAAQALVPEGVNNLSPENARHFRQAVLTGLSAPRTATEGAQVEKLIAIAQSGELFKSDAERSAFEDHLMALAKDPRTSPSLQVEAINVLGARNAQQSAPLLRDTAGGAASGEVRIAAARALEQLHDVPFANSIDEIMQNETDPAVRREEQEIRNRVKPLSKEVAADAYDSAGIEFNVSNFVQLHPELAQFDVNAARQWIRSNYPLLDQQQFTERAAKDTANRSGSWFESLSDAKYEEAKIVSDLLDERFAQWDQLVGASHGSGTNADSAKLALFYIARDGGDVLGRDAAFGYVKTPHTGVPVPNPNWSVRAAKALNDLSKPDEADRDVTLYAISAGLGDSATPVEAAEQLRNGLSNFITAHGITNGRAFQILKSSLEADYRRVPQNEAYQQHLWDDIDALNVKAAEPVKRAARDYTRFEALRARLAQGR